MGIDAKTLMQLRNATGAGISDCQTALEEAQGDIDKAIEILRKKGAVKAAKKIAERTATEGYIGNYIHSNGKIGVLVDLRCETDFVARNPEFKALAQDIAMHVAAMNPSYLKPEEVPAQVLETERGIYREQLRNEGKPEQMWDQIIEGKLKKFYQENCLLQQVYVKDESLTIDQLVNASIAKIGEKIEVARFVRVQI